MWCFVSQPSTCGWGRQFIPKEVKHQPSTSVHLRESRGQDTAPTIFGILPNHSVRTVRFGSVHSGKRQYFATFKPVTKLYEYAHVVEVYPRKSRDEWCAAFWRPAGPAVINNLTHSTLPRTITLIITTRLSHNPLSLNRPISLWTWLFIPSKRWLQTALIG